MMAAPAPPAAKPADSLHNAGRAMSYMWLGMLVQRLLTFGLNAALLRFTSAEIVGFASNDMELLLSTIMFLSREGCRMVALRTAGDSAARDDGAAIGRKRQQLVNLAWLPVLPGMLAAGAAAAWFLSQPPSEHALAGERAASLLYCAAAAIELLSEPYFILTRAVGGMGSYGARAATEITASIAKVAVTFTLAAGFKQGATAFAWGQAAFAACLWLGYGLQARRMAAEVVAQEQETGGKGRGRAVATAAASFQLMPAPVPAPPAGPASWLQTQLGPTSVSLLAGFTGQTLVKHVLTELDRLLLAGLTARSDRGAYAVAANYGGLAARLIFQPVEEFLRNFASCLMAAPSSSAASADLSAAGAGAGAGGSSSKDGKAAAEAAAAAQAAHRLANQQTAARVFLLVTRLVTLVGGTIALFGHYYSPTLVGLALGKWADTAVPEVMAGYAVYVLCMALNGVTEAFVAASADTSRLAWGNLHLAAAAAACTGGAMWALPRYGTVALVWINCANMLLRTLSSCAYISAVLERIETEAAAAGGVKGEGLSLSSALPHPITLAVMAGTAGVLQVARAALPGPAQTLPLRAQLQFLATGVGCGLVLAGVALVLDALPAVAALRQARQGAAAAHGSCGSGQGSAQQSPVATDRAKAEADGPGERGGAGTAAQDEPPASPARRRRKARV